jgi:hypothetical protein
MAVIFGRTATTTLNRGVQLVVTPDFKVIAPGGGGGGGDVTPNALNWDDIDGQSIGQTNEQTISGISTSIVLRIEFNGSLGFGNGMSIYINNTQISLTDDISNNGFSNQTVNNNDVVYFYFFSLFGMVSNQTTIKNASDNNTILDTFIVDLAGDQGGA